ncbi:MAG: hypothetical protein AAGA50_31180 [Pseudomonadota bacterium]
MDWLTHGLLQIPEKLNRISGMIDRPAANAAKGLMFASFALIATTSPSSSGGLPIDCESYARAYADAHTTGDPSDLTIVDGAMRGAVIGGGWKGPGGARRGALAGGALSVLDSIGNYPGGWQGMYDLAYRMCRNDQSGVTHRPKTLGDPTYRPRPSSPQEIVPPLPTQRQLPPIQSR